MEYRKPDQLPGEDKDSDFDGLEAAADDIMRASAAGDKKAYAAALRAAFEILDSEPHVEGEHLNEQD